MKQYAAYIQRNKQTKKKQAKTIMKWKATQ